MATELRPLSKPEELAQVPLTEPVLVELPPGVSALQEEPERTAPPAPPEQPDDGVKALKEQYEAAKQASERALEQAERARREAAEERQRREAAEAEAQRIREASHASTKNYFGSALEGAQAERDAALLAWQQAFEASDGKAVAAAQSRLSRAEAKIVQIEAAQADFESQPPPQRQESRTQQAPSSGDMMARIDADPNLLTREKEWIKAHPEVILDSGRNQELGAAYARAMRKGLTRGSDAYFQFLDSFMEFSSADESSRKAEEEPAVSAPVTRSANQNGSSSQSQIRLTPEQRELARSMGLTDVQYATGVLKLEEMKRGDPERFQAPR